MFTKLSQFFASFPSAQHAADSLNNAFAKKKGESPVSANLFTDEATSQLVTYLTRVQDMDAVLKQVGIRRDKLRTLLFDDEIYQAVETRTDALLATPVRLEPSEGPAAEFLMTSLEPIIHEAMAGAFQARLFGYSVIEAVYKYTEDNKIGLAYLGEKPFEWFEPQSDGRLLYYPDNGSANGAGIEVDQQFKFFLTRARPTYRNPLGEALLSRLYWPWFFRTSGWKFWGKFLERFGSPLLVGKSSDTVAMANALLQAHSQSVMGVDNADSVEAVGVPSGNTGMAFDTYEAAVIRRIQKVVLGQTLTSGTDNGSGNRALGAVHNSVREDKRNSDIKLVQSTIQRVIDALCTLNGFEKHEVVFADEVGLEKDRSDRDKNLYAIGVRFDRTYFEDNYDLNETDFTLTEEVPEEEPSDVVPDPKKPKPGIKASKQFAATKTKFTRQQQAIEDLADDAIDAAALPLDGIREAVLAATSPDDLQERLFMLIGEKVSEKQFQQVTERALYAADVLGYIHAEGKV